MLNSTKATVRCLDVTLPSSSTYIRRVFSRTDHDRLGTSRRYSFATKKVEAAATATQTTPIHNPLLPFVVAPVHESVPLKAKHLNAFLRQRTPLTIIPTPLPCDVPPNHVNNLFFPDTHSQDLLAIIDTCLNECYDVPRARDVFESMRIQGHGKFLFKIHLYNNFLKAYGAMAIRHDEQREEWIQDAWVLFSKMEAGDENVVPNADTYAIMALLWKRSAWMANI